MLILKCETSAKAYIIFVPLDRAFFFNFNAVNEINYWRPIFEKLSVALLVHGDNVISSFNVRSNTE